MTLSVIEEFVLDGDHAHEVVAFTLSGARLILEVVSHGGVVNEFVFDDVELEYEELLLDPGEVLELPEPLIGFENRPAGNNRWRFLLNAGSVEWVFESRWPTKSPCSS